MRKLPAILCLLLAACGNEDSTPPPAPSTTTKPTGATTKSGNPFTGLSTGSADAGTTQPLPVAATDAGTALQPASTESKTGLPRFAPAPDAGQTDELLTCAAHLFGQPLGNGTTMHAVSDVKLVNPTNATATVLLNAQIQGYSAPGSTSVTLPSSSTIVAPAMDLTLDYQALYRISAPLTANLALSLSAPGNPAPLDVQSTTLLIYPKNTIFWAKKNTKGDYDDLRFLISVFVTPHDQGRVIDQLLKEASAYSRYQSMIGYQYMPDVESPESWTGTAQPGQCQYGTLPLQAGSDYTFSANSTCTACATKDGYLKVYTQSDWKGARSKPIATIANLGTGETTVTIPASDTYVVAACSPSSAGGPRSFTFGMTPAFTSVDGAFDQMASIFMALQKRKIVYVNVPQDFFEGAQNVKYPAESIATGSANCIDGTLIFASALESMGMRPGIVMVPGHATVAVLVDPEADACDLANWLPIETTMMATATPEEAAVHDIKSVMPQVTGVFAKGCKGYKPLAPTLFDIQSLRDAGFRPAPL